MALQKEKASSPSKPHSSPLSIILFIHKAIRNELDVIHRSTMGYADGQSVELRAFFERCNFLKSIYENFLNVKDEVIYTAVDARVKNIAETYFLQHQNQKLVLDHLYKLLISSTQNEVKFPSKELVCFTGSLQTMVSQCMAKEEEQRCGIVNGVVEAEKGINDSEAVNQELAPEEKGVPNFWYHAMVNHELLDSEITLRDGEALKYLTDIKWLRKDDSKTKGFILEFCFNDNPFFKNSVLTKTYQFLDYDETILYKAIGMEIEWYPENCLTKERESFFDFFHPLEIDEWDAKELIEDMRRDYYIGSSIRNQIIPRAVLWYLDEAVPGDKVVGVTDSETDDWYYYDDQITEDEDDESENEDEDDESENEDEDDESENEDNI